MKKKEEREIGVRFVIRGRSSASLNAFGTTGGFVDHLIVLNAKDIAVVAPSFVNGIYSDFISEVTIETPLSGKTDITPILDALQRRLKADASIHVNGAFVDSKLLNRLLSEWAEVHLCGCELGKGWWKGDKNERRCARLWLEGCVAEPPPRLETGTAAWPSLIWLTVSGPEWNASRDSSDPADQKPTHIGKNIHQIPATVKAFYAPMLELLNVYNCTDISFLCDLPALRSIKDLSLDDCPMSEKVFRWMTGNKSVETLFLSWAPGVRLPWERLSQMKKLRHFVANEGPFDDEDLRLVLAHTKLRSLWAWYSHLSAQSWPLILASPSLRDVTISKEMLEDPVPPGMPESTKLRVVETINIGREHREFLEKLLRPYPNVRTWHM